MVSDNSIRKMERDVAGLKSNIVKIKKAIIMINYLANSNYRVKSFEESIDDIERLYNIEKEKRNKEENRGYA